MPYLEIANFSAGANRSRPIYAGPPGSLWSGINGHISRGGDFEKRKAFVPYATLPESTWGLAAASNTLYVFGHQAAPTMPSGVSYQQLTAGGPSMTGVPSVELFDGKLYVIADYSDMTVRHFYNGSEVTDWNTVTIMANNRGRVARTHDEKVYSGGTSILHFSDRDDASNWDGTGSGNINMATHQSGSSSILALAKYQKYLATFARRAINIWSMAADPVNNAPVQVIEGTGARAGKAVLGYGDLDVFYLADTGIRSLRSRDITNSASVNDVGTPIDVLVREVVASLPTSTVDGAVAAIEPLDGRFMLAIGGYVFVFSYFPATKISAWTWYEPGFTITDFAVVGDRLYCRAGNQVYLYGGASGEEYDASRVTLALPFLGGQKIGQFKGWTGMDIAATGAWESHWLVNPRDLTQKVEIGDLDGFTIMQEDTGVLGHFTHVAPVLVNDSAGPASVSSILLHYEGAETSD